jgi:uncharacterized membrane protein YidH (DUF202 family)
MRDAFSGRLMQAAWPAAIATATVTPVPVDRTIQPWRRMALALTIGAGGITFTGTNKLDIVIEHSDDGTTFVPVTAADMLGVTTVTAGSVLSFQAAKAAVSVHLFAYIGDKRAVRATATFGGTHATGTLVVGSWICEDGDRAPIA